MKVLLRLRIGPLMSPQGAVAQAVEHLLTAYDLDRAVQHRAHPLRHLRPGPEPAVGRLHGAKHVVEFGFLLRAQHPGLKWRVSSSASGLFSS